MRGQENPPGHTPGTGTVPLDAAAGSFMGAELEKSWGYAVAYGGGDLPAPAAGGAKKAAGRKPTGLELSIEPLGKGVLLAIRNAY